VTTADDSVAFSPDDELAGFDLDGAVAAGGAHQQQLRDGETMALIFTPLSYHSAHSHHRQTLFRMQALSNDGCLSCLCSEPPPKPMAFVTVITPDTQRYVTYVLYEFLCDGQFVLSSMGNDNVTEGQGRLFVDVLCNLTGGNTKHDSVKMVMDSSGCDLAFALHVLHKMSPQVVDALPIKKQDGGGVPARWRPHLKQVNATLARRSADANAAGKTYFVFGTGAFPCITSQFSFDSDNVVYKAQTTYMDNLGIARGVAHPSKGQCQAEMLQASSDGTHLKEIIFTKDHLDICSFLFAVQGHTLATTAMVLALRMPRPVRFSLRVCYAGK
jgi:hypothetical protein